MGKSSDISGEGCEKPSSRNTISRCLSLKCTVSAQYLLKMYRWSDTPYIYNSVAGFYFWMKGHVGDIITILLLGGIFA